VIGKTEPPVLPDTTRPSHTAIDEFASDGCKIYRNEKFGYSFHYPVDATLQTDDADKGISVVGPLVDGDNWPIYYFRHPGEPAEYHSLKE
jgi:hypothetical protein